MVRVEFWWTFGNNVACRQSKLLEKDSTNNIKSWNITDRYQRVYQRWIIWWYFTSVSHKFDSIKALLVCVFLDLLCLLLFGHSTEEKKRSAHLRFNWSKQTINGPIIQCVHERSLCRPAQNECHCCRCFFHLFSGFCKLKRFIVSTIA